MKWPFRNEIVSKAKKASKTRKKLASIELREKEEIGSKERRHLLQEARDRASDVHEMEELEAKWNTKLVRNAMRKVHWDKMGYTPEDLDRYPKLTTSERNGLLKMMPKIHDQFSSGYITPKQLERQRKSIDAAFGQTKKKSVLHRLFA